MDKKRSKVPVSVQLILKKEDKVFLLRRANTGFGDGKYGFVGGHVEENEEIKKAMIREAKEEIDIDIKEEDLQVKYVMNRKVGEKEYIDFVLTTDKWSGEEKIMEPEKCDHIGWYPMNELPENIIDFEKHLLKEHNDFYIPWGWEE